MLCLQVSTAPPSPGGVGGVVQSGCVAEDLARSFCKSNELGSKVVCCHRDQCNHKLRLHEETIVPHGWMRKLLQSQEGELDQKGCRPF